MSETWTVVFLGIIALSTFVMMSIQVGAIIYAARMAKRLETVVTRVEKDIQPIVDRLTAVSDEAVRMSQLATQQVERVDRHVRRPLAPRRTDHGRRAAGHHHPRA